MTLGGRPLGCSQSLSTGNRVSLSSLALGNWVISLPSTAISSLLPLLCVSLLSSWSYLLHNHIHIVSYFVICSFFPLKYSFSLLSLTVSFCNIFSQTPASLSLPSPAEATFRTEKCYVWCARSLLCVCVGPRLPSLFEVNHWAGRKS